MKLTGFKVGIYIDHDNLVHGQNRTGLDYQKMIDFVESHGMQVVRASTYMAVDFDREGEDEELRDKNQKYRNEIRATGFRVIEKPLMKYENEDGSVRYKGNVDIELAVDALTQSDGFDYILLGTGDGDFRSLVRGIQDRGKRVEGFAFRYYSSALLRELDRFYTGDDIKGFWRKEGQPPAKAKIPKMPKSFTITPVKDQNRAPEATYKPIVESPKDVVLKGKIATFVADKGYGFITPEEELAWPPHDRENIYFHMEDVRDSYYSKPHNLDVHKYMINGGWLEYVDGTNSQGVCARHVRLIEEL